MVTYNIKKMNNNEYKEIDKHFKLNVSKFVGDVNTLYFDVENEQLPYLVDYQWFFTVMLEQSQKGLLECLEYEDGVMKTSFRDGNVIKNYTYDFSFEDFKKNPNVNKFDKITRSIYKILSMYRENPNSHISSRQKYIWLIYDIIDGDRMPIINDESKLRRIFEIYNYEKKNILNDFLENVEFYEDGVPVVYKGRLKKLRIDSIKNDVMMQMSAAMAIFAQKNNATEIYQEYLDNIYIERREISFKYYDKDNNEIDPEDIQSTGTFRDTIRDIVDTKIGNLREIASEKKCQFLDKTDDILMRIKKKN